MPTRDTLERFIRRVEEGAHAEACEEFYTEDATMQENRRPRGPVALRTSPTSAGSTHG